ncbi:hypothetical protein TNCV_1870681 [Trichonephila clavipes]|nr:hypothetical protein TNCV_1870681 [Trichonephila clavipes]
MSDRGPRKISSQRARCAPVVSSSFEHHTAQCVLARFHSNFEEEHLRVVRGLRRLSLFHQPHERICSSTAIWTTPHAAKALYIYKHPCLLRYSNPGPTAQ